jgi:hypothetical protein
MAEEIKTKVDPHNTFVKVKNIGVNYIDAKSGRILAGQEGQATIAEQDALAEFLVKV